MNPSIVISDLSSGRQGLTDNCLRKECATMRCDPDRPFCKVRTSAVSDLLYKSEFKSNPILVCHHLTVSCTPLVTVTLARNGASENEALGWSQVFPLIYSEA